MNRHLDISPDYLACSLENFDLPDENRRIPTNRQAGRQHAHFLCDRPYMSSMALIVSSLITEVATRNLTAPELLFNF
jgi:hypothetical protein